MKKTAAMFTAALFGFGAAAQAATVEPPETRAVTVETSVAGSANSVSQGQGINFAQFDTSLGSLTSVTLEWDVDSFEMGADVTNTSSSSTDVDLSLAGGFSVNEGQFGPQVMSFNLGAGPETETVPGEDTVTLSIDTDGGSGLVNLANFSYYEGTGDVELWFDVSGSVDVEDGGNITTSDAFLNAFGDATLTYNYEPTAIPSPATLPAGLMLVGMLAARRPRRQRA